MKVKGFPKKLWYLDFPRRDPLLLLLSDLKTQCFIIMMTMMTMTMMTMMMMMMSTRINHNNALSDSFSTSIISDLNSSNEDIQNPKLEHYAALAT